jgi:hypothetical protein
MASPAKRRKKNDGLSQPVRGLDYFFARQANRSKQQSPKPDSLGDPLGDGVKDTDNVAEPELTDEQVARKLQEQYNLEYRAHADQLSEENDGAEKSQSQEHHSRSDEAKPVSSMSAIVSPTVGRMKTLALQSTTDDEDTITANIPFDESPLTFNPDDYTPQLKNHWAEDRGHATYALLTRCFVLVNATTSRIKIVDTLVNLLRIIITSDPDSLLPAVRRFSFMAVRY